MENEIAVKDIEPGGFGHELNCEPHYLNTSSKGMYRPRITGLSGLFGEQEIIFTSGNSC